MMNIKTPVRHTYTTYLVMTVQICASISFVLLASD